MPQFVDLLIQSLNCTDRIEWFMLLEKVEDLWTWLRFFNKLFKSQRTNFIVFINENVYIGWHKQHLPDGYKYLKQNACWHHRSFSPLRFCLTILRNGLTLDWCDWLKLKNSIQMRLILFELSKLCSSLHSVIHQMTKQNV